MGGYSASGLNTSGFSQSINQKRLPCYQHITHSGTYNEQFFQLGYRSKDLLQLYNGIGLSNCQLDGIQKRNYFLSLFLKSSLDGQPRTRNINACIALDISGSMNTPLNHNLQSNNQKSRLELARNAIWMFFSKLKNQDIFSLVVFHTEASIIISSQYRNKLNQEKVKQFIYQEFQSGGTTIRSGFDKAISEVQKNKSQLTNYQHRIVIITDVNDNSVEDEHKLIDQISQTNEINTTIIGVSSDFQSKTCQKLKQVKGFNYFCAVQDKDLQTFLVNRFDYTFFPCLQNIQIKLKSTMIKDISVYGSNDQNKIYDKVDNCFIVTKIQTVFPSQIIQNNAKSDEILSLGGLILVKFHPFEQKEIPSINMQVIVSYEDLVRNKYSNKYQIKSQITAEEYYSNSAVKRGVQLFYFAESMRRLLKIMGDNFNVAHKQIYIQNMKKLLDYCPEKKKKQVNDVIQIIEQK